MRVGLAQLRSPDADRLAYAAQFGATDIVLNRTNLPVVDGIWPLHEIVNYRLAVEQYGLKLSALENPSVTMMPDVILGGPKRDQQIENMIATVRNIARAGIPIFGYGWNPSKVWRTAPEAIRGGAVATA